MRVNASHITAAPRKKGHFIDGSEDVAAVSAMFHESRESAHETSEVLRKRGRENVNVLRPAEVQQIENNLHTGFSSGVQQDGKRLKIVFAGRRLNQVPARG